MAICKRPLYRVLASLCQARKNCLEMGNREWDHNHSASITELAKNFLPSGSGIDTGTCVDMDASNENKLVLTASYHHMSNGGMYAGWTYHTIVITPSLASEFDVKITGRNRNDIKDHLVETYHYVLQQEVWQEHDADGQIHWQSERFQTAY